MCRATPAGGAFDPRVCPLLVGLSPEEQEERMRDDPRIARCIRSFGRVSLDTMGCDWDEAGPPGDAPSAGPVLDLG